MKEKWYWLGFLAICTSVELTSLAHADSSPKPVLTFDNKGRLVLVVTPSGTHCAYQYSPNGQRASPLEPSCGEPQAWLKGKN